MVNNPGCHFPFCAPPLVVWAPHCLGLTYQFRLCSSRFGLFFQQLTHWTRFKDSWGNGRRIVQCRREKSAVFYPLETSRKANAAMALYKRWKVTTRPKEDIYVYTIVCRGYCFYWSSNPSWTGAMQNKGDEGKNKKRLETRLQWAMTSHVAGGWFKSSFACGKKFL